MNHSPSAPTGTSAARAWRNKTLSVWQGMSARERVMVGTAFTLILLALLWWVAIAPAWRTLQAAPAQHQALDAKLLRIQAWSAEAEGLKSLPIGPVPPRNVVMATLQSSTKSLGAGAQLSINGERALVQVPPTDASSFARWLSQVRINARVLPVSADLKRVGDRWTGRLELAGPGLSEGGAR